MRYFVVFAILVVSFSCSKKEEVKTLGSVERIDPALDAIIKAKSVVRDPDVRRTWVLLGDPSMRLK